MKESCISLRLKNNVSSKQQVQYTVALSFVTVFHNFDVGLVTRKSIDNAGKNILKLVALGQNHEALLS